MKCSEARLEVHVSQRSTRRNPRPAARPAITASQPADRDVQLDPSPIARSIKNYFISSGDTTAFQKCGNV